MDRSQEHTNLLALGTVTQVPPNIVCGAKRGLIVVFDSRVSRHDESVIFRTFASGILSKAFQTPGLGLRKKDSVGGGGMSGTF